MPHEHSVDQLFEEISRGSRRALAKGLSLIESTAPHERELAMQLLERCGASAHISKRIGLTGAPGVGKSSFAEQLGMSFVERGERVAVLAVDPSSRKTGGSILGDKVRMPLLSNHTQAFVRPSPSRLALGGTTPTTRDAIVVCEAAGYTAVIVESVGVGQSETDLSDMVDAFLLLVLPTAGDDVQGIKRGIMEMANAILVSKADIDEQATAMATAMYVSALRLLHPPLPSIAVPVLPLSSRTGAGVAGVLQWLDTFFSVEHAETLHDQRRHQRRAWFDAVLQQELTDRFLQHPVMVQRLRTLQSEVDGGTRIPTVAVHSLLSSLSLSFTETI
jgi:LAO/AO transport system kinase